PDRGTVQELLGRLDEGSVELRLTSPQTRVAAVGPKGSVVEVPSGGGARCAAGRVLEIQIPLSAVSEQDETAVVEFHVRLMERGRLVQRLPRDGEIRVMRREPIDWRV